MWLTNHENQKVYSTSVGTARMVFSGRFGSWLAGKYLQIAVAMGYVMLKPKP